MLMSRLEVARICRSQLIHLRNFPTRPGFNSQIWNDIVHQTVLSALSMKFALQYFCWGLPHCEVNLLDCVTQYEL
ncbi:hypothetical protein BST61_g10286 [Cercospora zeina]